MMARSDSNNPLPWTLVLNAVVFVPRFLIQNRTGGEGHFAILTKDMVHMAMQVALGVAFLHTHRIWHRDIATRNCM